MPSPVPISENITRYSWKRAAGAASFWLVAGVLAGQAAAVLSGEHGSVVFLGLGIAVGIAGAVSHSHLLATEKYNSLNGTKKVATLWSATMFALLLLAAATATNWDQPYLSALQEAVSVLLVYCALPTLLAAPLAVHLVESAA